MAINYLKEQQHWSLIEKGMRVNWVKKLDLQKSEEKSFVEKMRSGKDGGKSRDGYNEL
jgi:hypothetical protein